MHETDTPNQVTDEQAELLNQLRTATEELKAKQRTTHLEAKIDEIMAKKKEIMEGAWAKDKSPDRPDIADDYATVHAPDLGDYYPITQGNPPGTPNLTDSMATPAYTPECIEGDSKYLLNKGDVVQNTKQLHTDLEHCANTKAAIQREVVELRHKLNVANMESELLKAKPKERSTPRDLSDDPNRRAKSKSK